jgi:hypothetical protein
MGFFGNLYDRASNFFSTLKDTAVSTFHNIKNTFNERGSTLLTGTHYVGPWNKLDDEYIRKHPPTDKIDEGGLQHDRDYSNIARLRDSGQVSKAEALKLIREAGTLGYLGIKVKNFLEDTGLINPNKFVAMKIGGQVKRS